MNIPFLKKAKRKRRLIKPLPQWLLVFFNLCLICSSVFVLILVCYMIQILSIFSLAALAGLL